MPLSFLSLPLNVRSHRGVNGLFSVGRIAFRLSTFAALAVILAIEPVQFAHADDTKNASVTIDRASAGFRGHFKVGRWTEVTVQVTTTGPAKFRPVFEISDPDGSATRLPGKVVEVATGGTHSLRGLIKSGRIESSLRVIVEDAAKNNAVLAERVFHVPAAKTEPAEGEFPRALTDEPTLIATIGKPAGFVSSDKETEEKQQPTDSASKKADRTEAVATTNLLVVELAGTDELATNAAGLESLDVVAIATQFEMDAARSEALRNWVHLGGRLVVSVGANVEKYLNSPISKWIPVPVTGATTIRDLSQLEEYSGKGTRIDLRGQLSVPAAKLGNVTGVREASTSDGPVLVQVPYGFGRVTFLTLDLASDPLTRWPGVNDFVRRMIHAEHVQAAKNQGTPAMLTHTGVTDMATQIHASQDHFPQVERLSMWTVMGLLVLYLLIVGPLDYLLVHRVLRRPGLTWVTFPVIVAVAAGLGVWMAGRSNGSTLKLNQLDLVDIDVDSQLARSRSWMTLYSPETARYQVSTEPKPFGALAGSPATASNPRSRITWNGVPEDSYSGMYRPGGFEIARAGYQFAIDATAIDNLPIPIWSTKSLMATWHSQVANRIVESDVSGSPATGLSGSFQHHLPAPLEDWFVAYGKMVYVPADNEFNPEATRLRPGRKLNFSANAAGMRRRDLNGFLTKLRRTTIADTKTATEKVTIKSEAYDPLALDTDEIFRILTFYNRAGGKNYTTLENHDLRSLDLSGLLELNRAVLFAKLDAHAAHLKVDGQELAPTNSATYVRIVIPVKDLEAGLGNRLSEHKP